MKGDGVVQNAELRSLHGFTNEKCKDGADEKVGKEITSRLKWSIASVTSDKDPCPEFTPGRVLLSAIAVSLFIHIKLYARSTGSDGCAFRESGAGAEKIGIRSRWKVQ